MNLKNQPPVFIPFEFRAETQWTSSASAEKLSWRTGRLRHNQS